MKFSCLCIVALVTVCTAPLWCQKMFIGPEIGYTLSTSVPIEVSNTGAPVRIRVGALAFMPVGKKLDLRLSLGYKAESGSFTSLYRAPGVWDPESSVWGPDFVRTGASRGTLNVVEPDPNGPKIVSDISTSTIDLCAELFIPVADIDTSGSKIGIQLGGYVDRLLSGKQTDDYSGIPNYQGPKTMSATFAGQFGFGALFGVGLTMPMGSGCLVFDIKYTVRRPTTITAETVPPTDQNVGWLMGPGFRFSVAYLFGM